MKKSKRIIWLDDDFKFMNSLEYLFNEFGFDIIKCASVAQAFQVINKKESNFLLLDVDFPGSNKEGIIFLEEVRKTNPELKVVIYTGYPDTNDAVMSIRDLSAADYIQKSPFITKKDEIDFFKKLDSSFNQSTKLSKPEKIIWYKRIEIVAAIIAALGAIIAAIITIAPILLSHDPKDTPKQESPQIKEKKTLQIPDTLKKTKDKEKHSS